MAWSVEKLTHDHLLRGLGFRPPRREDFRNQAPWTSSESRMAATHDGRMGGWQPGATALSVMEPSGWPPAPSIEGLFDPIGPEERRFIWESDDRMWVNGRLADGYLRKLMLRGDPQTTAMRIARPPTEAEVVRAPPRRLACTVAATGKAACGCLCQRYEPTLVVPLTLIDKIELNNELRPTARMLVAEANIGAILRRAGVERSDIALDAPFKPRQREIPPSHRVSFKVRNERRLALLESGGEALAESVETRLERAEYEMNMQMLPHLKGWIEKYRSVKVTRRCEKARKLAVEEAHDREHLREQRKKELGEATAEGEEEGDELAPEKAAAAAVFGGPHRAIMCCRCGHSEVWHKKPDEAALGSPKGAEEAAAPKQRTVSFSTTNPLPLRPPGPATLTKGLPLPEERLFPMIADAPPRRPPSRSASEPRISGGRLLLRKAGASALLQQAPQQGGKPAARIDEGSASEAASPARSPSPPKQTKKERKATARGPPGRTSPDSPSRASPSAPSTPPPQRGPKQRATGDGGSPS